MSLDRFKKENCSHVRICAPMVRYSKLAFRSLVRLYDVDLACSPMIMADSFVRSQQARDSELTTNDGDRPLVVQFASHNAEELAGAAALVRRFADGVDLNCGCPQRWAIQEGIGCALLKRPEIVRDLLVTTRRRVAASDFSVSAKIRLLPPPKSSHSAPDAKTSVELARRLEHCHIDWLTVHARTPAQRGEPVDLATLSLVASSVSVPVVANGDVRCRADADRVVAETGSAGVMVARGLLTNPTLFTGVDVCPPSCIRRWLDIAMDHGVVFAHLHYHLMQMVDGVLTRPDRRIFNALASVGAVTDFLENRLGELWNE